MDESQPTGIRSIFCATDFSETSDLAVRHAAAMARAQGARVVLAHVVEPLPVEPYPLPMALPEGEAKIREAAWARLEELGDSLREDGVLVETQQGIGPAGPQLVDMIKKAEPTLVVMGTRGQTGLSNLVLGSTAEHVVRRSTKPVLTIHPEDRETIREVRSVVVPTDLSPDAEVALDGFLEIFGPDEIGRVDLVFADSTPPYLEAMSHERLARFDQPDARRDEILEHLRPMLDRLAARGFEVEIHVLDGDPVTTVTRFAEEGEADLIVMSTHGRSAVVNFLLGRTAQRIVQRAPCPVLTVCPKHRQTTA